METKVQININSGKRKEKMGCACFAKRACTSWLLSVAGEIVVTQTWKAIHTETTHWPTMNCSATHWILQSVEENVAKPMPMRERKRKKITSRLEVERKGARAQGTYRRGRSAISTRRSTDVAVHASSNEEGTPKATPAKSERARERERPSKWKRRISTFRVVSPLVCVLWTHIAAKVQSSTNKVYRGCDRGHCVRVSSVSCPTNCDLPGLSVTQFPERKKIGEKKKQTRQGDLMSKPTEFADHGLKAKNMIRTMIVCEEIVLVFDKCHRQLPSSEIPSTG